MPGKKKNKNRPAPPNHSDSLRADIAAAQAQDDGGDDVDIASELLASLDARDEAEARVKDSQPPPSKPLEVPGASDAHPRSSVSSGSSGTSGHSGFMSGLKDKVLHHVSPSGHSPKEGSPSSPRQHGIKGLFGGHGKEEAHGSEGGEKKVGRQKARKQRKEASAAADRARFEEELKANGGNVDEAAEERRGMQVACDSLGADIHEITPDGHCLYAAIADQLKLHGVAGYDYKSTRKVTSRFMKEHREDFLPFISDIDESMAGIKNSAAGSAGQEGKMEEHYLRYCDAIEQTGVWGGQPEILAMSRAFHSQIWVVQAGQPIVKVGEGEEKGGPLMISYHRRMYGLGEHYNSLHPRSKQ